MHSGTDPQRGIFGRARHLEALDRAVRSGLGGGPPLTLVVGDAGIGKTTLVDLVVAGFAGTDVRVLRGFADEGSSSAFAMWSGVRHGIASDPVSGDGDIEERRWEQMELLGGGIGAAAPALVVLEDAHWADDESLWVLERLPHVLAGSEVAFVVTSRNDSVGRVRPNHVMALAGLNRSEVAELVGSLGRDMPAGDVEGLTDLTGGNPLFVREIAVYGDRGRLPAAVEDALAWTLRGLGDEVLGVLLALALGGADLPRQVLAEAVAAGPDRIDACIDAAMGHGIVVSGPQQRLSFRHALLADAVRRRVGADRCRALHAALGAAWSACAGSVWETAEAARHMLAAVPETDAVSAADTASEAAVALAAAGDPGGAADLLQTAERVVGAHVAGEDALRARLLVERGDALDLIGNEAAARDAYDAAADSARRSGDATLLAHAEAGAANYLNPLEPAPETVRRLNEAAHALGDGDDPLRVALLGRLAWACAAGSDATASRRHGDEAVAMARRLDDPELLAGALVDRHFAPADRDGVRDRRAAAGELVELGEAHRRPRISMLGLEWQFDAYLDAGDVDAAVAALDRFEDHAAISISPRPRHRACILRGTLRLLSGDRPGALDMYDRALEVGRGALTDRELDTLHMATRATVAWLWGVPDPAWVQTFERVRQLDRPSPFFGARHAQLEYMVGNGDAARTLLARLLEQPDVLVGGYQGIPTLLLVGELVCELDHPGTHVAWLRRRLEPLRGLLAVGTGLSAGVDATSGRLALLDGDAETAVAHLNAAVALTSSMPSPPLEARSRAYLGDALEARGEHGAAAAERAGAEAIAARIGMDLHPDYTPSGTSLTAGTAQRWGSLVHGDSGWEVVAPSGRMTVPAMVGMDHLACLLARPWVEVAATELAGMGVPQADLGPVLDAQAKREYRRRVSELEAEIDEAEQFADAYREERAREELAAVLDELRRAAGLLGRDRPSGSGTERARVNVTRNLRRVIAAIAAAIPELGSHLDVSVRTGSYCSYAPEPAAAIEWVVEP